MRRRPDLGRGAGATSLLSARKRTAGVSLSGEPNVALTFVGDGATNIGTFHEALDMAAVWQAPVVFIVTNNLYGEYSPLRETTPTEAVERARSGGGPSLLEMKTYRYRGQSRSDPARYRPAGELEAWKERDPLQVLGRRLFSAGLLSTDHQSALARQIEAEVDAAVVRAEAAPYLTLEEARSYVYAD